MCARGEGSDETARMRRLVRASAVQKIPISHVPARLYSNAFMDMDNLSMLFYKVDSYRIYHLGPKITIPP